MKMQERHRPGGLKQQNKPHKHGRHRSKGSISSLAKGKMSSRIICRKRKAIQSKQDRRHQLHQVRCKKQQEALMKKRSIGEENTAPLSVVLLSLDATFETRKALDIILNADEEKRVTFGHQQISYVSLPRWKQRFSFLSPHRENVHAVLDAVKVADAVVFVMSATSNAFVDEISERLLTCLFAQGLPSVSVALTDLESVAIKKRNSVKQDAQKAISHWIPDEKVIALDRSCDALNLLRKLGTQKRRSLIHRDRRSYLLADSVSFAPKDDQGGTLLVSGYLRGQGLSVNGLLHICGWGDFQMEQIDGLSDPHATSDRMGADKTEVLAVANESRQVPLAAEIVPDPMDAEQTWPTPEELLDAKKRKKLVKRVPAGTSDYQACWIPDDNDFVDDDDESEAEGESNCDMDVQSDGESEQWEEACEEVTVGPDESDDKYDAQLDEAEELEALAKLKAMREEAAFPDEIDTPKDVPARERFGRYRGLASFRTSPWDLKENLPRDYARIVQFEHFDRTRRRIIREQEESLDVVMSGRYISIHVKNVPSKLFESRAPGQPLILCGLLPHEHQMSVMNFVVKRSIHDTYSQCAVKSKDPVIIHCGFRRYKARPIYSQHTNGTKHKYERYFRPESTMVGSVYAPITFPPAPVLFFTEKSGDLLATGRVLSADPDRLIIKRVILSGHPFRVFKRHAIIRFMFFNREDIDWFKPVELQTKYGRRGHIREPIGTHGHMKAVFDDQLKSQDTVMMMLYKRVFPVWAYDIDASPPLSHHRVLNTVTEDEEMDED